MRGNAIQIRKIGTYVQLSTGYIWSPPTISPQPYTLRKNEASCAVMLQVKHDT